MQTKNCNTCAHGSKNYCLRGYFIMDRNTYPENVCDENFSAWEKKQGIFTRLSYWLFG